MIPHHVGMCDKCKNAVDAPDHIRIGGEPVKWCRLAANDAEGYLNGGVIDITDCSFFKG